MMIYLQKSRQSKKNPFWVSLITVLIIVTCVWAIQRFAGKTVSRVAINTGGPVAGAYFSVANKVSFVAAFMQSRSSLVLENKTLRADIENNQAKLIRLETLEHEHQELLSAYSRSSHAGSVILGNVISKPPQSPYDVLIIDVGGGQGISVGNRVHGAGGLPIGRVEETTKNSSKIVLFSSVGEETQVVDERTGNSLTVIGEGGGNLKTEVAQDLDIAIGDNISLPQFGGAVLASVIAVDTSVTSSFKKILFRMPINVFNIRWVEVLKSGDENNE